MGFRLELRSVEASQKVFQIGARDASRVFDERFGRAGGDDATAFVAAAREQGVLVSAVGPTAVRLVTHLDVTGEQAEQAAAVLTRLS